VVTVAGALKSHVFRVHDQFAQGNDHLLRGHFVSRALRSAGKQRGSLREHGHDLGGGRVCFHFDRIPGQGCRNGIILEQIRLDGNAEGSLDLQLPLPRCCRRA